MSVLGGRLRQIAGWQFTLGLALFALGFLVAAQLRSEGPRVQYTTQERTPLVETALGLQSQQEALKARILQLNEAIAAALAQGQGSAALVRQLNDELTAVRAAAGLVPLRGPGLILQLEDSRQPAPSAANPADYRVTGQDLRTVVEELWLAGAEAVAINGERVVTSTAILDIGGAILVNSAYLAPPYQVAAIGPPDLYDQLVHAAGFVDFIRARAEGFGLQVSVAQPADLTIPAYAGFVNLRYGQPVPSPSASP
jgi:uncharacterized protein YlxW (UPF0749 family)